jgi:hypothetical protein
MKRQIAQALIMVLGFCLIPIVAMAAWAQESASAQRSSEVGTQNAPGLVVSRAEANIPFDFWIGPEKIPAGDYTLQIVVPSVAIIRSADGKLEEQVFMVDVGRPVTRSESKLAFVTRDDKPMLFEVWSIYGKRRLSAESAAVATKNNRTRVVELSYH